MDPTSETNPPSSETNLLQTWEISRDEIEINFRDHQALLGKGGWGKVYRGKCRGKEVAVKVLFGVTDDVLRELKNEAKIMSVLHHENILLFMGLCTKESEEPMLVMEYMENGDLFHYIRKNKLSLAQKMRIAQEIALGMYWLARKNIVHLDLKTSNFLISDHGVVKVADFGFSRLVKNLTDLHGGTYNYAAPELLMKEEKKHLIGEKTDVFSFGMCLWELFSDPPKFPWEDEIKNGDKQTFKERIAKRGERPPMHTGIPQRLQDLIRRCWAQDPNDRPSFADIIDQHILTDIAIDEAIKDEKGREFWKAHFHDKFEVDIVEFVKKMCEHFFQDYIEKDSVKFLVLDHVFAENRKVSMERFGKILKWFHFRNNIIDKIVEWYRTIGFRGILTRAEAEQVLKEYPEPVCFLIRLSENSSGHVCVSIKEPTDPNIQKKQNNMDHILIPITNQNYLRSSEYGELQSMSQLIERFCRKHKTEVKSHTELQIKIEAKLTPKTGEHHYTVTQDRYRQFHQTEGPQQSQPNIDPQQSQQNTNPQNN